MRRTQDEIVADLRRRADVLDTSAKDKKGHKKSHRFALMLAAQALRVAAEQNSFEHPNPAEYSDPSPWYRETGR